jgi:hypothetical protein
MTVRTGESLLGTTEFVPCYKTQDDENGWISFRHD